MMTKDLEERMRKWPRNNVGKTFWIEKRPCNPNILISYNALLIQDIPLKFSTGKPEEDWTIMMMIKLEDYLLNSNLLDSSKLHGQCWDAWTKISSRSISNMVREQLLLELQLVSITSHISLKILRDLISQVSCSVKLKIWFHSHLWTSATKLALIKRDAINLVTK
jgi:hypothetical protein